MVVALLETSECERDTPVFRHQLADNERVCQRLESRVDRLMRAADTLLSQSTAFSGAEQGFSAALQQTVVCLLDDWLSQQQQSIGNSNEQQRQELDCVVASLSTLGKLQSSLVRQIYELVASNVVATVRTELGAVRERRHAFERVSTDLDACISRQAQLVRGRAVSEHREAAEASAEARTAFAYAALSYHQELTAAVLRQQSVMTSLVGEVYEAYCIYFRDGCSLSTDLAQRWKTNVKPLFSHLQQQLNEVHLAESAREREHRRQMAATPLQLVDRRQSQADVAQLPRCTVDATTGARLVDGYLFKRASGAFRKWNRRWFVLTNGQLLYRRRCGDADLTVVEPDLRLCHVRAVHGGGGVSNSSTSRDNSEAVVQAIDTDSVGGGYSNERLHCFEVVSPAKCHMLQAESTRACRLWIDALQTAIADAFHEQPKSHVAMNDKNVASSPSVAFVYDRNATESRSSHVTATSALYFPLLTGNNNVSGSTSSPLTTPAVEAGRDGGVEQPSAWQLLAHLPGNQLCADCQSPSAEWASINLGVTLCIECSGIHRSLGVHVSKIRSLRLDTWEPEIITVLSLLGNQRVNAIYEASLLGDSTDAVGASSLSSRCAAASYSHVASAVERAVPTSDRAQREAWIRSKYVMCSYVRVNSASSPEGHSVSENATCQLHASAAVADLAAMCAALALGADVNGVRQGVPPLFAAVQSGSTPACQYLLLNGADVAAVATDGSTALHQAVAGGHMGAVCALLKQRVPQHVRDARGRDALSLAVARADADMVTVLRLATLSEQMTAAGHAAADGATTDRDDTFDQVLRDFSRMAAQAASSSILPSPATDGADSDPCMSVSSPK